jgi:hypothetical protein
MLLRWTLDRVYRVNPGTMNPGAGVHAVVVHSDGQAAGSDTQAGTVRPEIDGMRGRDEWSGGTGGVCLGMIALMPRLCLTGSWMIVLQWCILGGFAGSARPRANLVQTCRKKRLPLVTRTAWALNEFSNSYPALPLAAAPSGRFEPRRPRHPFQSLSTSSAHLLRRHWEPC